MFKMIFICFLMLISCNVYASDFDLYELTDSIKSSESYKLVNSNSNKSLHVEVYLETCILGEDLCDDSEKLIFHYNDYSMNYYFTYIFNYDEVDNLLFYNIKIDMENSSKYEELLVSSHIISSLKEGYLLLFDIEYSSALVLSKYGFDSYDDIYYSNLINKSIDYTKYLSIKLDFIDGDVVKDTVSAVEVIECNSSNLIFYNIGAVFILIIIGLLIVIRKLYIDNY